MSTAAIDSASAGEFNDQRKRSDTERISPSDILRTTEMPQHRDLLLLDSDAPQPEVNDPVLVPESGVAPDGILGIVTKIRSRRRGRAVAVETRPASLDEVYSQVELDLAGKTLAQIERPSLVRNLLKQFECDRRVKTKPAIEMDLGKLKPKLHLNLKRGEFEFVLVGTPTLSATIAMNGKVKCKYTGDWGIPVPLPGPVPLLLTLKPALNTEVSGELSTGLTWRPFVKLGVSKSKGKRPRRVHDLEHIRRGKPEPEPTGTGMAGVFLGLHVDLSVAGRVGIGGAVGPKFKAMIESKSTTSCLKSQASLHYKLKAFAKPFFKRREWKLKADTFGPWSLWEKGLS